MRHIPILNTSDFGFEDKLAEAFQEIGFAAIENDFGEYEDRGEHIDQGTLINAYAAAEHFFGMDKWTKETAIVEDSHGQEGYTRFGTEKAKDQTAPDLKEFYQIHNNGPYRGPYSQKLHYDLLKNLFNEMNSLALKIMKRLGANVALPCSDSRLCKIIGYMDERKSILRAIHYPPTGPNPNGMRSAAHEDINLITLLPAASAAGLQVLNRTGEWVDAPTDSNLIIVNVGDMLQEFTNGELKSTTHRVVNTEEGKLKSRYSMPFFFHPKESMVLSDRYTAGSYLDQRLREIGLKK